MILLGAMEFSFRVYLFMSVPNLRYPNFHFTNQKLGVEGVTTPNCPHLHAPFVPIEKGLVDVTFFLSSQLLACIRELGIPFRKVDCPLLGRHTLINDLHFIYVYFWVLCFFSPLNQPRPTVEQIEFLPNRNFNLVFETWKSIKTTSTKRSHLGMLIANEGFSMPLKNAFWYYIQSRIILMITKFQDYF